MRRVTALVALLAALAGAGCGGDDESEQATSTPTPAATTPAPTSTPPLTETASAEPTPTDTIKSTKTRKPKKDPVEVAQAFFVAMDDFAIHLDTAIGDALNGKPGATTQIKRFRRQIRDRLNKYLLAGGDTSIGGNLLLSAATQAQEAAIDENLPRMVDARREITDARNKLADEAIG